MGTQYLRLTDIHHNRRPGPAGGLDHSFLQAALPEQCTVGIPQHCVNRNRMGKGSVQVRLSKPAVGITHLCKIIRIQSKQTADFFIPFQIKNIKELCPGRAVRSPSPTPVKSPADC